MNIDSLHKSVVNREELTEPFSAEPQNVSAAKHCEGGGRVGYIVEKWPMLSTTFIHNEMRLLVDEGLDIRILALSSKPGASVQSLDDALRARTFYHSPKNIFSFGAAHLSLLFSAPLRYFKTLLLTLQMFNQSPKQLLYGLYAFYLAGRAARWGQTNGIAHFHAHFAGRRSAVACAVFWLTGISFSFTVHAGAVYRTNRQLLSRIREASFVVAISDHIRETLLNITNGKWAEKIYLIRLGVRPDQLRISEAKQHDGHPTIIAVGRLEEEKGFSVLIDACRTLKERGERFRCVIIGEGRMQEELNEQIKRNQVEQEVFLLGPLPHDAVMHYISEATVMAMPCIVTADLKSDGIPTVLSEAMGSGVPVISTTVGGIPELVRHLDTGLIVEQKSVNELADAIEALLDDADIRRKLALSGKAHVLESFDLVKNTRKLAERLRVVVEDCA